MFPELSLSSSPGTHRLLGLVDPRLRYSCWQVVFYVKLGTFFKVLLAVGMGAHGRPLNSN